MDLINRGIDLVGCHDIVFAAGNHYQAYLFALFHRVLDGSPVVGVWCIEAEVEGLVRSDVDPRN